MIKVLLLFILLFTGIVLDPLVASIRDDVPIQTDNYNIETGVTGLVIILILTFIVLFIMNGQSAGCFGLVRIPAAGFTALTIIVPANTPVQR